MYKYKDILDTYKHTSVYFFVFVEKSIKDV